MNETIVENLISKMRALSPQQVAEVEDFVEFLATRRRKEAALDRLLEWISTGRRRDTGAAGAPGPARAGPGQPA